MKNTMISYFIYAIDPSLYPEIKYSFYNVTYKDIEVFQS